MIRVIKGLSPTIHPETYLDESSRIIGDVRIERKASIWPNVVLRGDDGNYIRIGEGTNIQDGSICHVTEDNPVIIGKNVTVGHGVILHACTVEDESRIGMGATILDGAVIETGAQVGANALVPAGKIIPSNCLAVGVPAKIIRDLNEDELLDIKENAAEYINLWKKYYSFL